MSFPRLFHPLWPVLLGLLLFALGGAASRASDAVPPTIGFTADEQAYLRQAGPVRMCVDPDWVPFERINEQGRHEGIAADLVQLVARRVGLRIELLPTRDWDASLAASRAGRCQIMSFLNRTPAREQWLSFTEPVFYDQNVIITREEHPFIGDPRGLQNEVVALPRGTMVEERIRRDFPQLRVVTTGSEPEAVTLVSERKADLTVRSLIVAAYAIRKEGLFNLKIAGQIPEYTNQLRIGVVKSEPVLRDILDKGVKTLTPQEREAIANRHVAIKVQQGVDYSLFWRVVLGGVLFILVGGLVMLVVLYWNRKLKTLNRELERLSVTDRLTGLYNRLKLDEVLEAEVGRARRYGQPFGVILLDIDHFKQINDTHGHQVGDAVLVGVAHVLEINTRQTDIVGRWGGEEFIVVCPHTELDGTRRLAEKLRQALAGQAFPGNIPCTASFGVAVHQPGDQVKDLVSRADAAMYAAKNRGRNQVEAG